MFVLCAICPEIFVENIMELESNNGEYYFELLKKDESAFNYFISEIGRFRR
jgi:hypothetical protein